MRPIGDKLVVVRLTALEANGILADEPPLLGREIPIAKLALTCRSIVDVALEAIRAVRSCTSNHTASAAVNVTAKCITDGLAGERVAASLSACPRPTKQLRKKQAIPKDEHQDFAPIHRP